MEKTIPTYIEEIKKINLRVKEFLEKKNIFEELKIINEKMLEANFWQDKSKSKKTLKEKKLFEDLTNSYTNSKKSLADIQELYKLALEENNNELFQEITNNLKELKKDVKKTEVKCFLSNDADSLDCYIEIHAGAGGTESQDWANMLRKMYLKWAETKKFKYNLISEHKGEEAGIKSSTIKIEGDYIFGWLKKESGIHRLVRISPFDSGARRHTSFASVWVYPVVDENIKIEILDKDLRIDTYRSSGAGGQHVNTTDSAVRITHLPSKIVVQCQNERSQHKNKETCLNMLKARLYDFEMKKKEQVSETLESSKSEIGWGHQIRSYVLQPYQLVKDNRTNFESTNPKKILDGEIDEFLEQSLYQI
ncbi:peptide chain release factor 2 [Candidatus Pelagibacter sp.]|nr:peptide chain release factor 2 [Candidatus Pelagibacter sp.]